MVQDSARSSWPTASSSDTHFPADSSNHQLPIASQSFALPQTQQSNLQPSLYSEQHPTMNSSSLSDNWTPESNSNADNLWSSESAQQGGAYGSQPNWATDSDNHAPYRRPENMFRSHFPESGHAQHYNIDHSLKSESGGPADHLTKMDFTEQPQQSISFDPPPGVGHLPNLDSHPVDYSNGAGATAHPHAQPSDSYPGYIKSEPIDSNAFQAHSIYRGVGGQYLEDMYTTQYSPVPPQCGQFPAYPQPSQASSSSYATSQYSDPWANLPGNDARAHSQLSHPHTQSADAVSEPFQSVDIKHKFREDVKSLTVPPNDSKHNSPGQYSAHSNLPTPTSPYAVPSYPMSAHPQPPTIVPTQGLPRSQTLATQLPTPVTPSSYSPGSASSGLLDNQHRWPLVPPQLTTSPSSDHSDAHIQIDPAKGSAPTRRSGPLGSSSVSDPSKLVGNSHIGYAQPDSHPPSYFDAVMSEILPPSHHSLPPLILSQPKNSLASPATRQSQPSPVKDKRRNKQKDPHVACTFCRRRKIACVPGPTGVKISGPCMPCAKRDLECVRPAMNRRGHRKKPNAPDASGSNPSALPAHVFSANGSDRGSARHSPVDAIDAHAETSSSASPSSDEDSRGSSIGATRPAKAISARLV